MATDRSKRRAGARARGKRGGEAAKAKGSGIQKPVEPDDALGEIVGHRAQSRPEMTRHLWEYIKSHELQDPEDGRVIRPDAKLRRVVGDKDRVSMLELGRFLNAHVRS